MSTDYDPRHIDDASLTAEARAIRNAERSDPPKHVWAQRYFTDFRVSATRPPGEGWHRHWKHPALGEPNE